MTGSREAARYCFGDFELDPGRNELRRAGEPVELLPTPLRLLHYLVAHRDRAVPKEELLDEVWGMDNFVTDRAVDTHIANLRKKVETKPSHPRYLITVPGVGYRFDD